MYHLVAMLTGKWKVRDQTIVKRVLIFARIQISIANADPEPGELNHCGFMRIRIRNTA
jgi:hypothetical protein